MRGLGGLGLKIKSGAQIWVYGIFPKIYDNPKFIRDENDAIM